MNRIAKELFREKMGQKKMSLNVPRVTYIISDVISETIIHDCGIVRLLFRYYVVAYLPRIQECASRDEERVFQVQQYFRDYRDKRRI